MNPIEPSRPKLPMEIAWDALNGDPDAIATIYDAVNKNSANGTPLPAEYETYFVRQSIRLEQTKDNRVLINPRPGKPGSTEVHLDIVRILDYFINKHRMKKNKAFRVLAKKLSISPNTVRGYWYNWPEGKRQESAEKPYQYIQRQAWNRRIRSFQMYKIASRKILEGKDTSYLFLSPEFLFTELLTE